ncbi:unnamed protein product [Caenorhabditis auriculariae]|uniref:RING-CH-type domain-containing protein n=1 Tax=Caenorhabditis auriculariae TaxID=2777116 RepID=A0A8S1HYS5_9PELO|nr:unnamed protein product [Caenorhabditis auriculariae]
MGLVMSVLSVVNEDKVCKFCYGDDSSGSSWLHPCRCIGTLYWVHESCFDLWMSRASAQQQIQCQTCRYVYQKNWVLKSLSEWSVPEIKMSAWQFMECFLDAYSTYKFIRGFIWMMEGRRSIFFQLVHLFFWRTFIMSDRRISYYTALGRAMLSGFFDVHIVDYLPENESDMVKISERGTKIQNLFVFDMSFLDHVFEFWELAKAQPYDVTQYIVGIVVPLIVVAFMFNWRIKQSLKKHKKLRRQREKLLKKLQDGRPEAEALENLTEYDN